MHAFVIILLCATVGQAADWSGYHRRVGIPEAERIRQAEQTIFINKIVGGVIAPVYQHPYLAGLIMDLIGLPHTSACGGSVISSNRILTAAHCWNDGNFQAWRFTVVLGSAFLYHGGLRTVASSIAPHPHYNARTLANDVAILYLPTNIQFSHAIQPVVLPTGPWRNFDLHNIWAYASGYGRYSDVTNPTINTMVRNVFLRIITNEECSRVYGDIVTESNVCTCGQGGVGICRGDSGGPLIVQNAGQNVLVGVSSFVASDGCKLGHPSAFARVTSYVDWIRLHL
ncbi:collagenase-like [Cydia pomonella]|uniref:collagenase-like n=1 Tax=Cydia pomonella TaxID=82600 RepID=UPI002ADDD675|nr:collagenase-like [Cydia pomonella]